MEELEARLPLLKLMESLEASIRALDTILFQIKGWCVTAALAIAGITVTSRRPALLLVGVAATIGFWLIHGIYKYIQRVFIDRETELERSIHQKGVMSTLEDDALRGPKMATAFTLGPPSFRIPNMAQQLMGVLREASAPLSLVLCMLVLVSLGLEGLLLT